MKSRIEARRLAPSKLGFRGRSGSSSDLTETAVLCNGALLRASEIGSDNLKLRKKIRKNREKVSEILGREKLRALLKE